MQAVDFIVVPEESQFSSTLGDPSKPAARLRSGQPMLIDDLVSPEVEHGDSIGVPMVKKGETVTGRQFHELGASTEEE